MFSREPRCGPSRDGQAARGDGVTAKAEPLVTCSVKVIRRDGSIEYLGEAKVEIPVEYKGEELDIVFNPDFIADYLKVLSEPQVELHLKDRGAAGVFRSGKDYVYVLMPLTINL